MFGESPAYAETNREAAANVRVEPSRLSDKTYGVVLFYSRFFATLTRDEAIIIATMIVNTVEETDKLNRHAQVKQQITTTNHEMEATND